MGVTRLKRKARRNKQTAAKRQNSMKQLNSKPVIKNIDKEAILASFGSAPAVEEAPTAAPEVKEEAAPEVVAEAPAVEEAPVAEEAAPEVEEAPAAEEAQAEEAADDSEEAKEEA